MVSTKKFSEMTDGGTLSEGDITAGLQGGGNAIFTSSTQFLVPGTTAERPDPATDGMIRFNTDLNLYEFYNGTIWAQFEDSADIALLIARLAAHTAGDGASMIGLEDQGAVASKTVQDLAEADFIVKSVTSSLANAIALSGLSTGILVNETGTGDLVAREIDGTNDQINVADGDGLAANPTLSIASNPILPGSSHVIIPFGTTAQRPGVASNGYIRYNTTLDEIEFYDTNASAWVQLGASGSVFSVTGTANEVDVDNTTPSDPVLSLSATIDFPGTFTVQGSTVIDEVIDDDTMATATDSNLSSSEAIKAYVDAQISGSPTSIVGTEFQVLANGNFGTNETGTVTLTAPQDIATTNSPTFAGMTLTADLDMSSQLINNVLDPVSAQDAATKAYVDSRTDLHYMEAVLAASTGNFVSTYANGTAGVGATLTATSNGAFSLDGEAGVLDGRYLMKNQTNTFENGIYTLTQVGDGANPAILTRATDFDQASEIDPGDIVPVLNGTVNGSTAWIQTATVNTIGTDAILFSQWAADFSNVVTITGTQTVTGSKTFNLFSGTLDGNLDADSNNISNVATLTVNDAIQHAGDLDNQILFGTDTQDYQTGGASRLDLSDTGMRLGGANSRVTTILDEDNMVSDSDTALATQQSIKAYVDANAGSGGVPVGAMIDYAGTSAPTDYLVCDGTAINRTTYSALFTAIGTTWGVGDGSTTFNLPNFNRRTAVGSGGTGTGTLGNAVGNVGGSETHTLSVAELAVHSHPSVLNLTGSLSPTGSGSAGAGNTGNAGSGSAHNNMQPSAVVLKCIKYQ